MVKPPAAGMHCLWRLPSAALPTSWDPRSCLALPLPPGREGRGERREEARQEHVCSQLRRAGPGHHAELDQQAAQGGRQLGLGGHRWQQQTGACWHGFCAGAVQGCTKPLACWAALLARGLVALASLASPTASAPHSAAGCAARQGGPRGREGRAGHPAGDQGEEGASRMLGMAAQHNQIACPARVRRLGAGAAAVSRFQADVSSWSVLQEFEL